LDAGEERLDEDGEDEDVPGARYWWLMEIETSEYEFNSSNSSSRMDLISNLELFGVDSNEFFSWTYKKKKKKKEEKGKLLFSDIRCMLRRTRELLDL
jgi:hypothetical protein